MKYRPGSILREWRVIYMKLRKTITFFLFVIESSWIEMQSWAVALCSSKFRENPLTTAGMPEGWMKSLIGEPNFRRLFPLKHFAETPCLKLSSRRRMKLIRWPERRDRPWQSRVLNETTEWRCETKLVSNAHMTFPQRRSRTRVSSECEVLSYKNSLTVHWIEDNMIQRMKLKFHGSRGQSPKIQLLNGWLHSIPRRFGFGQRIVIKFWWAGCYYPGLLFAPRTASLRGAEEKSYPFKVIAFYINHPL